MQLSLLESGLLLIASGAVGGFVHALRAPTPNAIILPFSGKRMQLGIAGDVMTGAVAAVAFMFIAQSVLRVSFVELAADTSDEDLVIQLVALGLIAGFAGGGMMGDLAGRVRKLSTEVNEVKEKQKLVDEVEELTRNAARDLMRDKFESAETFARRAFEIDPEHAEALATAATARSYRFHDDIGVLRECVAELNTAAELDPRYELAHYNAASVMSLASSLANGRGEPLPYSKEAIASALKRSIDESPVHREFWKTDGDFKWLAEDGEFLRYLGSS